MKILYVTLMVVVYFALVVGLGKGTRFLGAIPTLALLAVFTLGLKWALENPPKQCS